MQHVRKIVYILIAVVFISAVAIGMGVMFSVKNVNVTLLSYVYEEGDEGAENEIGEIKQKLSSSLKGSLLASVSEERILETLDGGKYTLEAFEKIYPCTVNVTVKERKETFAVTSDGEYCLYDENGTYLKNSDGFMNSFDNAPNVILEGVTDGDGVAELAKVCAEFKVKFSSLRSVVERVELIAPSTASGRERVIFHLRCGVSVELQDFKAKTSEKMSMAFSQYEALSGEQKLGGKIYCYSLADGSVSATYDKNG